MPESHRQILLQAKDQKTGEIKTRILGRPKKESDEKQNPYGIRLSLKQREAFKKEAIKAGYQSWQTWLKDLGEKAIEHREAN
jgi:hypothetical protein